LKLAPWSILIVALVFSLVHLPNLTLVLIAFLGGLLASYIFYKYPNIIPLGIAHGILGVVVYYLILGKDVLQQFIASLPQIK